jgi:hypothetical protein
MTVLISAIPFSSIAALDAVAEENAGISLISALEPPALPPLLLYPSSNQLS